MNARSSRACEHTPSRFLALFGLLLATVAVHAAEEQGQPRLGGPDQVENQLQVDRAEKDTLFELKFLDPYFEWQAQLKEKHGFAIGVDYTAASSPPTRAFRYRGQGIERHRATVRLLGTGRARHRHHRRTGL